MTQSSVDLSTPQFAELLRHLIGRNSCRACLPNSCPQPFPSCSFPSVLYRRDDVMQQAPCDIKSLLPTGGETNENPCARGTNRTVGPLERKEPYSPNLPPGDVVLNELTMQKEAKFVSRKVVKRRVQPVPGYPQVSRSYSR